VTQVLAADSRFLALELYRIRPLRNFS